MSPEKQDPVMPPRPVFGDFVDGADGPIRDIDCCACPQIPLQLVHPLPPFSFGNFGGYEVSSFPPIPLDNHPMPTEPPLSMNFGGIKSFQHLGEHMKQQNQWQQYYERLGKLACREAKPFIPAVNIFTDSHEVVVHVTIPGAKVDDVSVEWCPKSHTLSVKGVSRLPGSEELGNCWIYAEGGTGDFKRDIPLLTVLYTDEVDGGKQITKSLERGILTMTLPKKEREWTEVQALKL